MKNKKTTASFVSLGCFKNLVDTEVLGGLLKKRDIEIVSSYEDSDWLIINTCGFIRDAKEESIDEILAAMEKKEQGEHKHIAVFGCLTQRYLKDLKTEFAGVDILWGVNDPEQLADLIAKGGKKEYGNPKPFLYNETHDRLLLEVYEAFAGRAPQVAEIGQVDYEDGDPEFPDDVEVVMARNAAGDRIIYCANWTDGTAPITLPIDADVYDASRAQGRAILPDASVRALNALPSELAPQEAMVLRVPRK